MNEAEAIDIGRQAILTMLKVGGPVMGMGLVVGVSIALFQALTSIQEMTLTFVPKIIIIFVSVMLFLPFMLATLSEFASFLFDRIVGLG